MTGWRQAVCGIVAVLLLVLLVAPAQAALVAVWVDPATGIRYERHDAGAGGGRTRDDYEDLAQSIRSDVHLAMIPDALTNAGIYQNLVQGTANANAWIGFYQPNAGDPTWEPGTPGQNGDALGGWRWYSDPLNTLALTYTNWGSGEPNDWGGNEHTAHMRSDGMWNDHNQTQTYDGIIQYPADYPFPHPVAQLSVYGATIGGRAYVYDPQTGDVTPPDRYVLEARPANQTVSGMLGQYCTAAPVNDNGANGWTVFNTLAGIQTYMAGQTVITQQLTGHAIDFPVGGGNNSVDPGNPFADIGIQVGSDPPDYGNDLIGYWSGTFNVTTAGTGTFWTASDDGSVLFIDGNLVVNNNYFQGVTERSGTYDLTLGEHEMVIAFFERGGGAGVTASWQLPDMSAREYIEADAFITQPEFQVLSDVSGVQVGDLLAMGIFPPDGRFGLDNGVYEVRLTVWGAYTSEQVTAIVALVPEPTTLALLGVGLLALARRRRR